MSEPRLRTADKIPAPYPLGKFSKTIIHKIAAEIVFLLHTRGEARLEGSDWEKIFAEGIGADWQPSNIGLDDVRLGSCCWGAKTVKNSNPVTAKKVRLISGRNSLDYSYKQSDARGLSPTEIGERVVGIWNSRVSSVRQRFAHCRTAVLIKSNDLSTCAVFEFETLRFEPERFIWQWNPKGNLVGLDEHGNMKFTWQPHGAQFTIVEEVPETRIAFSLRIPEILSRDFALKALGFDESWIKIV